MQKKTVKISIKPAKLVIAILIIFGVLFFIYNRVLNFKKTEKTDKSTSHKEVILPRETGVADSGFEGKVKSFATLNAKATIDAREKIDGVSSLKMAFSGSSVASVKIPDYFNSIREGDFYRLGFWAKSDSESEKRIDVRIAEKEKTQNLGKLSLKGYDASYFEFTFQANNDAQDLILTSSDAIASNIWIDDVSAEKINVNSQGELNNIQPTVSGNTTWKNVDQSQEKASSDSGDFLSFKGRKIGQIFEPSQNVLSGVAFKVFRKGTGGNGTYRIQLREYNPELGVISDSVLAESHVDLTPSQEIVDQIKQQETQMKIDFANREQDIKTGKIPNDKTEDHYPDTFTQDQIDASKAAKRAAQLDLDISNMKESFNDTEEIDVPLAAKIDSNKKYWVGIDNSDVTVDRSNYISVVTVGAKNKKDNTDASENSTGVENDSLSKDASSDNKNKTKNSTDNVEQSSLQDTSAGKSMEGGFMSETDGIWKNSAALWFKTFYPIHKEIDNQKILSGATISDMGDGKLVYRYGFALNDGSSLSGFSGCKIYDMLEGKFDEIAGGNYKLSSYDQYAIYQFNTLYPAKKIIIRDIGYHQSLMLEISMDRENWEEIFSDNPADNNNTVNPIVYSPKNLSNVFYLRFKPSGDFSVPFRLSLDAELEKTKN